MDNALNDMALERQEHQGGLNEYVESIRALTQQADVAQAHAESQNKIMKEAAEKWESPTGPGTV